MTKSNLHSFHIPVMGLAYTIDTPIRIAHLGISSTISIMDDDLMEQMNRYYSQKYNFDYQEITNKDDNYRAKRITSYLNLVNQIVKLNVHDFCKKIPTNKHLMLYFMSLLPNDSILREGLKLALENNHSPSQIEELMNKHYQPGAIDVNIMTKVDREHFKDNVPLPAIFNDAHAALRGFSQSKLQSSVVLSAGMNLRLYSYFEEFDAFYPTENSLPSKKIILKVSDYRSALIQGQQLAKRGLWVSEYRIESGLNCGGHAFATDGQLIGPVLKEFKEKRSELIQTMHTVLCQALEHKNKFVPTTPLPIRIAAQGGVGTSEEHQFLLDHYELDSIGWGSPFLLVPEAISIDKNTISLLAAATEKDLYLSDISPLGVPFNTVRNTTNEIYKTDRIIHNKPGSSCPKKYLALDKTFEKEGTCTASRKHQTLALNVLAKNKANYTPAEYQEEQEKITVKSCLCVGLANASLLELGIPIKGQAQGVVVCPGPNIAYFSKEASLLNMVEHIYGRYNLIEAENRPPFFVKELGMYCTMLIEEQKKMVNKSDLVFHKKIKQLKENLLISIDYYLSLFSEKHLYFQEKKEWIVQQLSEYNKLIGSC